MTDAPTNHDRGRGDAYRDLAAQLELAKTRAAQADFELRDLRGSTSWKLTAPLRALATWLRRPEAHDAPESDHVELEVPLGIPPELQRFNPPPASSDASARIIDGRPLLAPILPPGFEESVDAVGRQAWTHAGNRPLVPSIGVLGSIELVRELAFCAHTTLLHDANWMLRFQEVIPDLVLLAPDTRSGSVNASDWVGDMADFCGRRGVPIALWMWDEEDESALALTAHASAVFVLCEAARLSVAKLLPDKPVYVLPLGIAPELYNPIRTPGLRRLSERTAGVRMSDALSSMLERIATTRVDMSLLYCESYWDIPASRAAAGMSGAWNVLGVLRPEDKVALWKAGVGEVLAKDPQKPVWWRAQQTLRMAACEAHAEADDAFGVAASTLDAPATGMRAKLAGLSKLAIAHQAMREALASSMAGRLEVMARHLGKEQTWRTQEKVSCLLVSKRPALATTAIDAMLKQTHLNLEVVLVLHGVSGNVALGVSDEFPDRVRVLHAPEHRSLGYCLNQAFGASSGSYWLKIDDDDVYGPRYVQDMMLHAQSIDYDLVGKPLVFTLFEQDDALYMDPETLGFANTLHRQGWPNGVVCGATLGGRRDVLERQPFPSVRRHGVDSLFLDECSRQGMSLLVADPFNFTCTRNEGARSHTWVGNERVIRSRGVKIGGGASIGELVNQ